MLKTSFHKWRLLLVSLLALANSSPMFYSLWSYSGGEIHRLTGTETKLKVTSGGMQATSTNSGELCVLFQEDHVKVDGCDKDSPITPWQSPPEWEVREVIVSDLNWDNQEEIAMMVWRPFKPWPVDRFMPSAGRINTFHDKNDMSCHLILIGLRNGNIKELWAGSAMADPLREIHAADLDGDGRQELVALEHAYNGNPRASSITVWAWHGFGFSLQARQNGRFSSLLVLPAEQGKVILTQ